MLELFDVVDHVGIAGDALTGVMVLLGLTLIGIAIRFITGLLFPSSDFLGGRDDN